MLTQHKKRDNNKMPQTRILATGLFGVAALIFVTVGLYAIFEYGWTEIYADQWRLYRIYLEKPFPADVLTLENGHRPVFPALLRVAEMEWLNANQVLQLAVGAILALCTVAFLCHVARKDESLPPWCRSAAMAMAALGIFWVGNVRYLLHGNESVHGYLLTTCLVGGLLTLTGDRQGLRPLWLALALAFIATFSFGPGMATFVALAVVLVVQRKYHLLPWLAAALALTLLLYFLLPGGTGVRNRLGFDPVLTLMTAAIWLCSAPVNMALGFLDPGAGNFLPEFIKPLATTSAAMYEQAFGRIWTNYRHVAVLGFAAIAYVVWTTIDTWRQQRISPALHVALGIAWFAMCAAGIVALARADYFERLPGQIFSTRFLPWSCLFWMAIAWIALIRSTWATRIRRRAFVATVVALTLAIGLATTKGHLWWGDKVQKNIRLVATGLAVGVLPKSGGRYGESFVGEILQGLPPVRSAGLSMFAWPESRMHGRRISWATAEPWMGQPDFEVREVENELPSDRAWEISFNASENPRHRRLLVVGHDDKVVGMLSRFVEDGRIQFKGYAVGPAGIHGVSIASVARNGNVHCHVNCSPP